MLAKIKSLCKTYREQILYLLFGGLTTVVDWGVSFAGYKIFAEQMEYRLTVHAVNVTAWVCAVLFAFFTNRILVFRSRRHGFLPVLAELGAFAGGRVVTLLVQEAIIELFVGVLGLNAYLFKIVTAVIVVIGNYFISKLLVFRQKKSGDNTKKADENGVNEIEKSRENSGESDVNSDTDANSGNGSR